MNMEEVFRRAGVAGWLHATDIDGDAEVSYRADELVPMASVFKLPVLVELARQADTGVLDPRRHVTVTTRTAGDTGVGAMLDDVTMSLRDLAYLMIAVSDNTSADAVVAGIGLESVNAMLDAFGLRRTRVIDDCAALLAKLKEDAGSEVPIADPETLARLRVLDPAATNRTTPEEITRLLAMIWRDEAASPAQCAWMRRLLGLQVWPHRLSSGFPYDDVAVSGKTGTLPTMRAEVGVVEYPDGGRYAVAVFTRSFSPALNQPRADAVIGTAARMAVDHLRA
ncbi:MULTISPECIES: serine hydrolase [unclassified Nonomuraea]|uniref:serine hydrolase n=1 Tax=Nonomuraea sp. NPDC003804 TaxID=3154547 RepID=UPI0033AA004B